MKRVRLEGTRYGDATPTPDAALPSEQQRPLDSASLTGARRVIRRDRLSRQLVLDARALFEKRLQRPVTEDEARNLLGNLTDLMWMLIRWETTAQATGNVSESSPESKPD